MITQLRADLAKAEAGLKEYKEIAAATAAQLAAAKEEA